MQLDALVGCTVLPPSGRAQCVSAGPGVGMPGLGHIEASAESGPLSLIPLLEPDPPLEPDPLLEPDPPLELDPLLEPESVRAPLELELVLEDLPELLPELELIVPSVPPSGATPLVSSPHAPTTEARKTAVSPPHMERRKTTDR